jgi:hypothetical protein
VFITVRDVTREAGKAPSRSRSFVIAVLVGGGLLLSGALGAEAKPSTGPACGAAGSARVIDAIDDGIAHQIYAEELNSSEVTADLNRITSSSALAAAVASGDAQQIQSATLAIVYTPVWHIVRLRVTSPSGQLLADIGGPYILAPVKGQITYAGKTVGDFVMSVQDDKGYKKLVTHITGAQVELYLNGKPLMGTLPRPPASPPHSGTLRVGRLAYNVDSYTVEAFPSGTLQVAVLVPSPTSPVAAMSCPAVKLATDTAIVENVAKGLMVSGHNIYENLPLFLQQAYGYTHLPVFVLDNRSEEYGVDSLPGSSAPPAPASLTPKSKLVSYDRSQWLVGAIRPFPPEWIYVLAPASSTTAAAIGATGSTGTFGGQ